MEIAVYQHKSYNGQKQVIFGTSQGVSRPRDTWREVKKIELNGKYNNLDENGLIELVVSHFDGVIEKSHQRSERLHVGSTLKNGVQITIDDSNYNKFLEKLYQLQ